MYFLIYVSVDEQRENTLYLQEQGNFGDYTFYCNYTIHCQHLLFSFLPSFIHLFTYFDFSLNYKMVGCSANNSWTKITKVIQF